MCGSKPPSYKISPGGPKCHKTQLLNSSFVQTVPDSVVSRAKPVNSLSVKLDVSYPVVTHSSTVHLHRPPQKKEVSPSHCQSKIKHVKCVCCVSPFLSAPHVPNAPNAVTGQSVMGRLQKFWQVWQEMGANPRVVSILKDGYTLPFKQRPLLTRFPLVQTSKWLCQSSEKLVLKRGLTQSCDQVGSGKSGCQVIPGVLQPTFSCSQAQQKIEANPRSKSAELISQHKYFQEGNSGDNLVIFKDRGMGNIAGLQRHIFLHLNISKVKKISRVLPVQSDFSVHSSSFRSEVKLMAQGRGIQIHQYLDDWLLRAPSQETCLQHTQTILALCQQLGWVVNINQN